MTDSICDLTLGDSALIATAIHDGHELRPEVAALMVLPEPDRFREEDPYTGPWTAVAGTRVVARRSRFEVDLNRPKKKAVYRTPEDAWGLNLWRSEPDTAFVEGSLSEYDAFYEEIHRLFSAAEKRHGKFVVFDIHSYNHLRNGPDGAPADPQQNPEVNIGTGTMERERWAPLIDGFIMDLARFDFGGRNLDVRENIKFFGGNLARWTHKNFPNSACVLAIEFKKFFMNEWTGEVNPEAHKRILEALRSTVPGVLAQVKRLSGN